MAEDKKKTELTGTGEVMKKLGTEASRHLGGDAGAAAFDKIAQNNMIRKTLNRGGMAPGMASPHIPLPKKQSLPPKGGLPDQDGLEDPELNEGMEGSESEKESGSALFDFISDIKGDKNKKSDDTIFGKLPTLLKIKIGLGVGAVIIAISGILLLVVAFKMMSTDALFQYLKDLGSNISTGIEKTMNLLTGDGWTTEDEAYFNSLKWNYDKYNLYPDRDSELDIALISTTINYGRMINPVIWTNTTTVGDKLGEETAEPGKVDPIDGNNSKNFYRWANLWVGDMNTLNLNRRGLAGALVSKKMITKCVRVEGKTDAEKFFNGVLADASAFLDSLKIDFFLTVFETTKDKLTDSMKWLSGDIILDAMAVKEQTGSIDLAEEFIRSLGSIDSLGYDVKNIFDFSQVNFNLECPSEVDPDTGEEIAMRPATRMVVYNDYTKYKNYLKTFFIPNIYLDCGNCSSKNYNWAPGEKEAEIEFIINQIFHESEHYNVLAGIKQPGLGSVTVFVPGQPSCPLNSITTSSGYGENRCYTARGKYQCDKHGGQDIPKAKGTPIYSIGDGTVMKVGPAQLDWSYGISAQIGYDSNSDGVIDYSVIYAHMSEINVIQGQQIGGGQKIGSVGSTGNSTGPHLHFEMRNAKNERMDPRGTLNSLCGGGAS